MTSVSDRSGEYDQFVGGLSGSAIRGSGGKEIETFFLSSGQKKASRFCGRKGLKTDYTGLLAGTEEKFFRPKNRPTDKRRLGHHGECASARDCVKRRADHNKTRKTIQH